MHRYVSMCLCAFTLSSCQSSVSSEKKEASRTSPQKQEVTQLQDKVDKSPPNPNHNERSMRTLFDLGKGIDNDKVTSGNHLVIVHRNGCKPSEGMSDTLPELLGALEVDVKVHRVPLKEAQSLPIYGTPWVVLIKDG